MRTCYDSTSANDIPTTAQLVGGYVDGIYKWSLQDWARFPNAVHVPIAAFPSTNAGTVGDVERGDMLPWELPDWVLMRRASGVDPTGYVNWSNWAPTRTEFQLRGIPEPHWWLASYDGKAEIPPGCVAKQYANSAISGGHYDLSAVADYWPGVDRPGGTAGSEILGGLQLDRDVLNTFKKLAVAQAAVALGVGLSDAGLDQLWVGIDDNFDNIETVLGKIPRPAAVPPATPVDLTAVNTKLDRLLATSDKVFK